MREPLFAVAFVALALVSQEAAGQSPASEAERGSRIFQQRCALCHAVGTEGGQGPGLAGVVGRRAASGDFAYSRALREAGLTWDKTSLDRYLADPAAAVPGTTMPVAVAVPEDRQAVIAYLATLTAPGAPSAPAPAAAVTDSKAMSPTTVLTGRAAFGDWRSDAPGVRRHIMAGDMPAPFASRSAGNSPRVVARPPGRMPQAPKGFRVDLFAQGLENPRVLRVAPNGDIFLAETAPGRIRLLRAAAGATQAASDDVFLDGLDEPFGMAFYPPGSAATFLYVAETNRILRFPYRHGDTKPAGPAEIVVARLTGTQGGHSTRDIVFTPDGKRLLVSVGSASNVAEGMPRRSPAEIAAWEAAHGLGAAWGDEEGRADVLSFDPQGRDRRVWATGLRNCVGLAIQPTTGVPWCSTNERDGLGDDLVPDYVTRVREGAFYGWPWFYVGHREEPRLAGQRPDLAGRMTDPDVLLQAHSASLGLAFYDGTAFPPGFRGDAFAAEHGSWNRARRTGYKVVRIPMKDAVPTGEYEDFLTGFVTDDRTVWGRPVGLAVTRDGALLVAEDGNGTVWRVAWDGADHP